MATGTVTLQVKVSWWLTAYVTLLGLFCRLHGTEPDWQKLERVLERAITVRHE